MTIETLNHQRPSANPSDHPSPKVAPTTQKIASMSIQIPKLLLEKTSERRPTEVTASRGKQAPESDMDTNRIKKA